MNWVDYLVPFGTAGGGAASVYGLVVRPRQKEHMRHEAERDQKRRETDAFLYGIKPIDGVAEETLSAPRRLRAVELSVAAVVSSNKKVVEGQSVLEERMKEANGAMGRIEGQVSILLLGTKALIADMNPNEGTTTKDALNRIEEEQERVAAELASKEK